MEEDIQNFLKDKIISNFDCPEHDIIHIFFKNNDTFLKLFAGQDCCSVSWFECLDKSFNSIIDKEILTIETKEKIDMEHSGRQEYDDNLLIEIQFVDKSKFKFVLRNSSNGYYRGWLEMHLINPISNI
jgi:hypothetical protein